MYIPAQLMQKLVINRSYGIELILKKFKNSFFG